jgi:hypothetical protein
MQIHDVLSSIDSAKIVSLRTKTQCKLLAPSKVRFPKGVTKISTRNGIIGASYENAVNNKLEREGDLPDFKAESLWKGRGRRVSKFIVQHMDTQKQYLAFLPKTNVDGHNITKSVYVDNATGLEVSYKDIKDYMPNYGTNSSGVNWQVIELSNVIGLKSGDIEFNA